MNEAEPLVRIPVGVVVERRKAVSSWVEEVWRPVSVLCGVPQAAPWTKLSADEKGAMFYAGEAEIELYRSDVENYSRNLASDAPLVWISLHETRNEPPYDIAAVTVDPAEGEALTEPGQALVEAVPMPEALRDAVADFIAAHFVEQPFEKRVRDRADPEALSRRSPIRERR
jgi:Protein of unknown function (DUF3305)